MAKIDELKERLTMLRFWLGIVVATFLAIAGWSITNYQKVESWLVIGASVFFGCYCIFYQ